MTNEFKITHPYPRSQIVILNPSDQFMYHPRSLKYINM